MHGPVSFRLFRSAGPAFGAQFLIVLESARWYLVAHGTARFFEVAAVAEMTAGGEFLDVGESGWQAALCRTHLQLAHARGVNQDTALIGEDYQLAPSCGVAAFGVLFANRRRLEKIDSKQSIGQRRFSNPRGTHECDGLAEAEQGAQPVQALAQGSCHRKDRCVADNAVKLALVPASILTQIDLAEYDRCVRATFPNRTQVALHPSQIELGVTRGHNEHEIDVGGDDLNTPTGTHSLKGGAALEEVVNRSLFRESHPVAYNGSRTSALGFLQQQAPQVSIALLCLADERVAILMFDGNPHGNEGRITESIALRLEEFCPPEAFEGSCHRCELSLLAPGDNLGL